MATTQILHLPIFSPLSSSSSSSSYKFKCKSSSPSLNSFHFSTSLRTRKSRIVVFASNQETELSLSTTSTTTKLVKEDETDPQVLEYISQVKRVLELLKKNRDMQFFEVKLTIMIEDPRDVERRRLLGIDDESAPTRDDLADVLDEINDGKIPEDVVSLQILAEELSSWPNLEVESLKNTKKAGKSLYAKATDTGVDPREAAKRLNIDWDTAAEIEDNGSGDTMEVPQLVGFGALYLVSAFPIIIGISVVLILFYNSLQ